MWPNYKKSIVNIMSSVQAVFGIKNPYAKLDFLSPKKIEAKNIVLLEIDGLGLNILKKNCKFFSKNLIGTATSIFPSTTPAGSAAFASGLPSQQHAILSWFMNIKELGGAVKILPFTYRGGGQILSKIGFDPKLIFDFKPLVSKIKASYYIIHKEIKDTDFSQCAEPKSKHRIGYKDLKGLFNSIIKTIKSNPRKKYIYAYSAEFDTLSHMHGPESTKARKSLKQLDREFKSFVKKIEGTNTSVVITADHGQISTPLKKSINLNKHKELIDCLALPVAGDARNAFFWIKPSKAALFKKIIKKEFGDKCDLYESKKLIKQNRFGLFKPNPKLFDRVGDFTLIPEGNYQFKDFLLGEEVEFNLGGHGGLSKEEMLVPVVLFKV